MIEAVIASALLAVIVPSAFAGMAHVRSSIAADNLRAIALRAGQRTIESLRARGAGKLAQSLAFNGVAANGIDEVWEADAVALGLVESPIRLRALFAKDDATGQWVESPEGATLMTVEAWIVSNGDATGRSENSVRAFVELEWSSGSRRFHESLFAVVY